MGADCFLPCKSRQHVIPDLVRNLFITDPEINSIFVHNKKKEKKQDAAKKRCSSYNKVIQTIK